MVKCFLSGGRLGNHLCRFNAAFILANKYNLSLEIINKEYIDTCIKQFKINENVFIKNTPIFNISHTLHSIYSEDLKDIFTHPEKFLNRNFNVKGYNNAGGIFFLHKTDTQKLFNVYNQEKNYEDVFIHLRLGDFALTPWSMPFEYFDEALQILKYKKIFVSTDGWNDTRIVKLKNKYNITTYSDTPEKTIHFASTFNQLILSEGSFSWWMQHLSSAEKIVVPLRNYGIKHHDPNCIRLPWTYKECIQAENNKLNDVQIRNLRGNLTPTRCEYSV